MEAIQYISIGVSIVGFIGGLASWAMNLKIKHDILVNNEHLEKELQAFKEKLTHDLTAVQDNLVRELGILKDRTGDRMERFERDLTELKANLAERILSIVNGRYVRTDLHQQTIVGVNERFESLKSFIEVSMDKIEQGLDRQILDLKERIFHDK